ncbi:MAG: hypothetical protein FWE20_11800, partial [Defluviitaleaceae bacterium]|nr:hypothetical protein [Defluviitaleaceae bacterium]
MRAKKWLVIITFDIAILALVGMFLCFFMFKNFYEIWYDIWLAVFGGATLGFIMSLIEYYAEKRSSMERFYVEALSSANAFSNVECLIINEPIELIKNCIHEEDTNKQYRKMSENLSTKEIDDMGWKIEDKARTAMISFLCNEKGMSIEELESQQLNELYNEKIIQCREKLHKCLDSYLKILDCSLLGDLSNAIGNLDFIFS